MSGGPGRIRMIGTTASEGLPERGATKKRTSDRVGQRSLDAEVGKDHRQKEERPIRRRV